MGERIGILVLMGLWAACGEGLTTEFPDVDAGTGDGAAPSEVLTSNSQPVYPYVDPPTLGTYGKTCGSFIGQQPALATFSFDGKRLAFSDALGQVSLVGTADAKPICRIDTGSFRVTAMAFHPRETLLATVGSDGVVKLWRECNQVSEARLGSAYPQHLVWSHSGARLVASSESGPVTLFTVADDTMKVLQSRTDERFFGAPYISPDDSMLVLHTYPQGGEQGGANRYFSLEDLSDLPAVLRFNTPIPFHSRIVAHSLDGTMILYNPYALGSLLTLGTWVSKGTGDEVLSLWAWDPTTETSRLGFTADSRRIARWGTVYDRTMAFYDSGSGALLERVSWASEKAEEIAFSPDGRYAVVVDPKELSIMVHLVGLETAVPTVATLYRAGTPPFDGLVSASSDGVRLLVPNKRLYGDTDTVSVWDMGKLELVTWMPWENLFIGGSSRVRLSMGGDYILGVQLVAEQVDDNYWGYLRVSPLDPLRPDCRISDPDLDLSGETDLSPDGSTVAASVLVRLGATQESSEPEIGVRLYRLSDCEPTLTIPMGRENSVGKVVFSPDGVRLTALHRTSWGAGDGQISIPTTGISVWDVASGRPLWKGSRRTLNAVDAAYSPDGKILVAVGTSGTANPNQTGVDVYDAESGTFLRSLDNADGVRESVRFSPDGRYLTVQVYGAGIAVWRTSDWQRFSSFGDPWGLESVFLPDGKGILQTRTGDIWCSN